MTESTSTTDTVPTATATDTTTDTPEYEKGTWQAALHASTISLDRSKKSRERATILLWQGAKAAIGEWESDSAATDVSAESLYNEVKTALGEARKGDASKIKTVALAVRNHSLDLAVFKNLSRAYAEAVRLTQTVKADKADDAAADKAIAALGPVGTTASTPEDAAKVVLAKGLDEAARLLLDALGADNEGAHRALVRAISAEVAGRIKPKASTATAGPKVGATQAKSGGKTTPKATVKSQGAKAKPATKAAPAKKAAPAPVSSSKGDPNKKALPPKVAVKAQRA